MAIPLTIITGFLGSGKTTFIEKLIAQYPQVQFGVIENEAAEVNIDGMRLKEKTTAWIEQTQGCLCCQIEGDLIPALQKVIKDSPKQLDHLILETTGLADPAPLIQALLGIGPHQELVRLDSVICLADALHFHKHCTTLGENSEHQRQLLHATRIVISKCDTTSKDEHQKIQEAIAHINPGVEIDLHQPTSDLPIDILSQQAYAAQGMEKLIKFSIKSLKKKEPKPFSLQQKSQPHQHLDVQIRVLEFQGELDPHVFELFLNITLARQADTLLRSKGILAFARNPQKILFQGVYDQFGFDLGDYWSEDEEKLNQLVLIGHPEMIKMWEKGLVNAKIKN
jgi:G3E family GTPase